MKTVVEAKIGPVPSAATVQVADDFTEWEKTALALTKINDDGTRKASVVLAPDRYAYQPISTRQLRGLKCRGSVHGPNEYPFLVGERRFSVRPITSLHVEGEAKESEVRFAIVNIHKICEEHLHGRYELEIVDIAQHPTQAAGEQIIAAPTSIKKLPLPLRRFIGDMSQTERILLGRNAVGVR